LGEPPQQLGASVTASKATRELKNKKKKAMKKKKDSAGTSEATSTSESSSRPSFFENVLNQGASAVTYVLNKATGGGNEVGIEVEKERARKSKRDAPRAEEARAKKDKEAEDLANA